jgi:hypothetical protein
MTTIIKTPITPTTPFSSSIPNTTTTATDDDNALLLSSLERKIAIATEGLLNHIGKRLRSLRAKQDIETVCNYVILMNAEINPSAAYRKNQIMILCHLSEFHNNNNKNNQNQNKNQIKAFKQMTRTDILAYLDSLRKTEAWDPLHKWIGTYNLRRVYFLRFFKWLHSPPNMEPKDRPTLK